MCFPIEFRIIPNYEEETSYEENNVMFYMHWNKMITPFLDSIIDLN